MRTAVSDHLAEVPLFAGLSPTTKESLVRASLVRHYPGGQILCSEGDPGDALYVLEFGRLRVSRLTSGGQETVLAVVDAPAALGELALLDGSPRDATVAAQGPVIVRLIPRSAFLAMLRNEPSVVEGLLRTLASWVRHANSRHAGMVGLDVPGRLAEWLLARADTLRSAGETGRVVDLNRSQAELAAELGTTRSTLNRALQGFVDLGIVRLSGQQVEIIDPRRLLDYTA